MATYQQNTPTYDAQSYRFTPYRAPYEQTLKTLQTKTNYWLEGAQQINNYWQKALNLDVTTKESQDFIDAETKKIDEVIKDVSSKDLSISDNVTKATNAFKPIFSNKNVMVDNQITEFYKQQEQLAEKYKTKDGGKQYSQENHQDLINSMSDFRNGANWENLADFYNKKRGYTPYYDYTKEYKDIFDVCKGSSNVNETPTSRMFIERVEQKGRTTAQTWDCLNSGLSTQAKNQIELEGRNRYRTYDALGNRDYSTLAQDYLNNQYELKGNYAKQLQNYDAALSATGDKAISAAEKKTITDLRDKVKMDLNNVNGNITQLESGDYSLLTSNYDRVAGNTYMGRILDRTAQAFANQSLVRELDTNVPQVELMKQYRTDLRQEDDQAHDIAMKELEYQQKQWEILNAPGKDGKGGASLENQLKYAQQTGKMPDIMSGLSPAGPQDRKISAYDDIMSKSKELDNQVAQNNQFLFQKVVDYVKRTNPNDDILKTSGPGPGFQKWFDKFWSYLPEGEFKDDLRNNYFKPQSAVKLQKELIANSLSAVEAEIKEQNKELFDRSGISKLSNVVTRFGAVTPDMIQDALEGKQGALQIISMEPVTETTYTGPGMGTSRTYIPKRYILNGRELTHEDITGTGFAKLFGKVEDVSIKNVNKYKQLREEKLKLDEVVQQPWFSSASLNAESSPTKLQIATKLNIPAERINFESTTLGAPGEGTGNLIVNIRPANASEIEKEGEERSRDITFGELSKLGYGIAKRPLGEGKFEIYSQAHDISDSKNMYQVMMNAVSRAKNTLMRNPTTNTYDMPPQFSTNGNSYKISVKKFGNKIQYQLQQSSKSSEPFIPLETVDSEKTAIDHLQTYLNLPKGQQITLPSAR